MSRLRPILPKPSPPQKPLASPSTDSRSAGLPPLGPLPSTWTLESHRPRLTERFRTSSPQALRTLDWDIEARAAGYGDPQWVPQRVTAIAWSWCDSDEIQVRTLLDGFSGMVEPFLVDYADAGMVTGHNLLRFDLPVLNADLLRNGYPSLRSCRVQDTMRIVKTKGLKKGQDNLSTLLTDESKLAMNWQEWENAYEEPGWPTVIERVVSDVRGHKALRAEMLRRGWLKPAVTWRP